MKITNRQIDLIIEILLLALIFLSPTIFDRRIGIVFSGTKIVFIRFLLSIVLSFWAVKLLLFKEHRYVRTSFDWLIAAFILLVTGATLASVHVYSSFVGFYGRYEGLISWFSFALLFFITANFIKDFRALKRVLAVVMVTAVMMSVYGIIQRFGIDPYAWGGVATKDRVIATIGQPNFLAAYIIMAFMLVLGMLMFSPLVPKPLAGSQKNKKQIKSAPLSPSNDWVKKFLPLCYFLIPSLVFIISIYALDGLTPIPWYLFFIVVTIFGLLFAYTFEELPAFIFEGICIASLVLMYLCLFYTQSRGGYLGFLVGLVLLLVFLPRKVIFGNLKKLSLLFVLIAIVTGITLMDPGVSPFNRFSSEVKIQKVEMKNAVPKEQKDTQIELSGAAGSRGETWKSGSNIIADNPVFGIGPEDLKMVFPRYETELFRFREAFHVKQDRCHNETFDVPVTKGMLTFFVYWGMVAFILFTALKKAKILPDSDQQVTAAALAAAMAAYIVQNQFSFGVVAIVTLFWTLWALVAILGNKEVLEGGNSPPKADRLQVAVTDMPWIPLALIFCVLAAFNYFSYKPFFADLYFKLGKTYSEMNRLDNAIDNFDISLGYLPYEGNTITNQAITMINFAHQQADPQKKNKMLNDTLRLIFFGYRVDPFNADNFHIASRVYLIQGDLKKARRAADQALLIDPYYAEAHLSLAAVCEAEGKQGEADRHYKEAFRINPELDEPKFKLGWRMIEENRLQEALALFQDLLMKKPQDPQIHNALGAIYIKLGQKDRARSEFEQTLSLDPGNDYAQKMLPWVK